MRTTGPRTLERFTTIQSMNIDTEAFFESFNILPLHRDDLRLLQYIWLAGSLTCHENVQHVPKMHNAYHEKPGRYLSYEGGSTSSNSNLQPNTLPLPVHDTTYRTPRQAHSLSKSQHNMHIPTLRNVHVAVDGHSMAAMARTDTLS